MEHCLCESERILEAVVQQCGVLSQNLHPREPGVGSAAEHARVQVECNVFGTGDLSLYMLGYDISAFNHSCHPNAAVIFDEISFSYSARRTVVSSVYAVNEIAEGEEIFIAYNATTGHDGNQHGFSCNCGLDAKQRADVREQAQLTRKESAIIARSFSTALCTKYTSSSEFAGLYALHERAAIQYGPNHVAAKSDAKSSFIQQCAAVMHEDKRTQAGVLEELFTVGVAVRIHQLVSRPELNGVCGVVTRLLHGSGRCVIAVTDPAKAGAGASGNTVEISVKFENLSTMP
jgi:hypothetical protein